MSRKEALSFAVVLVMAVVGGATLAAAQGGGTGGDVLLSLFEHDDSDAAVAYNSHAQEFLVVWNHQGNIYGQRYDVQGVPQGENFPISITPYGKYHPAVAYSLHADAYLVVWQDLRNTAQYDIYGQLVDADGTLLDNPSTPEHETDPAVNFGIYTGPGDQQDPDLDFDGSSYLVVWESENDGSSDVRGRFVQGNGTVELAVLPIATGGNGLREWPAVSYNSTANEYLVVFAYGADTDAEIRARRVHPAGTLPGDEYTVVHRYAASHPDIAAAAWGAYVVVWDDRREVGEAFNIYGQVVLAGADNSFDGTSFPICTAIDNQFEPAIARSPSTGQFLVVWKDWRASTTSSWDIYGQRLLPDANLTGLNFAVSAAAGDQEAPAIAAGQSPDVYFVAWEDRRSGAFDLYGQRVAGNGSLLWYEFAISAQPGAQEAPAITYNAAVGEYVAVWQDDSGAIYGQRLSADGQPLTEPWAIEDDKHRNRHPDVACANDGRCLVLWRVDDANMIGAQNMSSVGAPLAELWVPDTTGGDHPRLAYNQHSDVFLMVWEQAGKIYATATREGKPSVESVAVWPGPGQSHPDVAFDPIDQTFLVVWEEEWPTNTRIYGSLLIIGDKILTTPSFAIAGQADPLSRHRPAVAYNPDARQFLVTYETNVSSKERDIYGQRLDHAGNRLGSEIVIRDQPASADQFGPDVAYAPEADRYYVIWAEYQDGANSYDLYGQWLDGEGHPASATLPFFRYPADQQHPRLAYDPNHKQGMVVWHDTRRGKWGDVYARPGALDTTPPTARFTRDPTAGRPGTTFTFNAWPSTDNLTPRGALAVRWDWTSDGRWDTDWSLDKAITRTVYAPGVYTVTLEVRDLMWLTDTVSIPFWVLADVGNTPPTASLNVNPAFGPAGTAFQFDASGSRDAETPAANLQVRWDWEDDGVFDTGWSTPKTRQHSYSEAGLHAARVEVRDGGNLTAAAVRSFLVVPGPVVRLEVGPPAATLGPGETIRFRATAWDAQNNEMSNPRVTWSVTNPRAGTIDASGVFTASMRGGTYPGVVRATSGSVSDTASVTIVWPHQIYLPWTLKR